MRDAAGGSGGGGIAFDTDNEGDWLFVQANDETGSLFGYSIDLRDVSGGGNGIRLKTFLSLLLEAANQISLLAHNGRVVIQSDETTVYPAEAILIKAPSGTVEVTADAFHAQSSAALASVTLTPAGAAGLSGNAGVAITSGADIEVTTGGNLKITGLPTVNPGGTGLVWNDSGTLKIT